MSDSIKVRLRRDGERAVVRSLIKHPMETGSRKDEETGELVPRHHITRVTFALNGKPVMIANCSTAVARNPYFEFSFDGARAGDRFSVDWKDSRDGSDSLETTIT